MTGGKETAARIAQGVREGRVSALEAAEAALERARAAADLNIFITLDEAGALEAAAAVDALVAAGRDPGPLAGVPVAVKDNIATCGLRTTAGSRALESFVPPFDATVVARLRRAGAVVVGKTNMDEFGMGSTGENSAFGPVRNPLAPERSAGGSSGGSAAAVAAGIVPLALGTDTGGSVRQPAAFCGVTGFKPTYGALSRYGVIAFASSLDQVGAISRDAGDAALALTVMAGKDDRDPATLPTPPDFAAGEGDRPLRVGLIEELAGEGLHPAVAEGLEAAARRLEAAGAQLGRTRLETVSHAVAAYYLVATAEASSNLARFDGTVFGTRDCSPGSAQAQAMTQTRRRSLGREVKKRVLMGTFALSAGFVEAYYGKALQVRRLIADELGRAFGRFDVLLAPTAPTPAFRLGEVRADPLAIYLADAATCVANLAGLPAVSVPAPREGGGAGESARGSGEGELPCGVQLMAPPGADGRLLAAARLLAQPA